MKKLYAACLLFMLLSLPHVFGQTKPRLGILPFAGGSGGDGETIATLFSLRDDLRDAFTIVPRTSAVNALVNEQNFQMSGYTDSDTIAGLGRMLNADFVVSGYIRRFGNRNMVITTIINVESFELLAGAYREYWNIEEIPALLPQITRNLIAAARRDSSGLPALAVAPFHIAVEGAGAQEAETLAQILAIEIANTGKFAVLPRTTTMQAAMRELEFQMSGHTADDEAKALGRAVNAEYVLSAEARSLGTTNIFIGQILHVEEGSLLAGDSRNYRVIDDGIRLMPELALLLTDKAGAAAQIRSRGREYARAAMFNDPANFWSIGVSAGSSFAAPWIITTLRGTIAPWRHMFFDIGFDLGLASGARDDVETYLSMFPYLHAAYYYPLKKFSLYAGGGFGLFIPRYSFPDGKTWQENIFTVNLIAGVNILDFLDISYTLRTSFTAISNKIAAGFTYRFK